MLRNHAAQFVVQLNRYLVGALWAYWNAPHETTASYLHIAEYRQELTLAPRKLAASNIAAGPIMTGIGKGNTVKLMNGS